MMKLQTLVIFCFLIFPLYAHSHHDHQADDSEEEGFHWTKEKTEFADLGVQTAGPGTIQNFIQVTGKILTHPDNISLVIPKVSGCVCEVRKNLGEPVEKGEILAVIESQEIAEAKANLLASLKQFNVYQTLWKKEQLLCGISPEQDYLMAELAAQEAEIQLNLSIQNLYTLGFTNQEICRIEKEGVSRMRFFDIKAPFKGKIIERNITLGESIDPSTRAFVVGSFEKVWVEMNVPQNDVRYLKEGVPVEVAAFDKKASVKICQFNPLISEETRTATAIALMENNTDQWSPGEFVTASVQKDLTDAEIVIPLAALQMIKGEPYVFIENGEEFIPKIVKLGKMDQLNVEIVSGIEPGMVYAARNTFALKAEYEKEEAEHSH